MPQEIRIDRLLPVTRRGDLEGSVQYIPQTDAVLASELRTAFTFFRRHADRRYSSQSLMRLLQMADMMDDEALRASDRPEMAVYSLPPSYDEETEVKTGGTLGCAVRLPNGRLM